MLARRRRTDEALGDVVRAHRLDAIERLGKVVVDGRAGDGVQALQLARRAPVVLHADIVYDHCTAHKPSQDERTPAATRDSADRLLACTTTDAIRHRQHTDKKDNDGEPRRDERHRRQREHGQENCAE